MEESVLPELAALRDGLGLAPDLPRRRDSGEVCRVRSPLGHESTLFSRYAEVRAVHADAARLRLDAIGPSPGLAAEGVDDEAMKHRRAGRLLMLDPPEHTRLRGLLTATFTVRRAQALAPRIEEIVDEHLGAMAAAGPPADLVSSFALPVPSLVICELLGVPFADRAEFGARSNRFLDTTMSPRERLRLDAEADVYMQALVAQHRENPGDDLLSLLIREHGAGALSDEELAGLADLILIAGHETTANVISLGTLALLQHPEQLALVRDDPSAVENAVEELLRYTSVLHAGFVRVAVEDTTIGGHPVRRGEHVVTSLPAANRDPALVANGDELDVTRARCPHLAFGHGIHHCLGATLARLELRLALPALLKRFPGLHLAAAPEFKDRALIHGLQSLPVAW
ncbi:cytochrome P450 [Amycolatopsis jejuensis]|uniref:cytochrome P450 n=1 Tax=Amycolatopsis jejuensis TaxID=330084 RepID=UPI0006914640|nr:cytochrome P450 [Amycolatopsis jejuensis]